MIRSALIALGVSASGLGAGTLAAQGMVPTAPIVASCGGLRIGLGTAYDTDQHTLDMTADVISRRVGGRLLAVFAYTDVTDDGIAVSVLQALTAAQGHTMDAIAPLLDRVDFAFMDVIGPTASATPSGIQAGQVVASHAHLPDVHFILTSDPILTGANVISAQAILDQNKRPAVAFALSDQGGAIFRDYTADHIRAPFALVLRGEVTSPPTIRSIIDAGNGIITGNFTEDETIALAAVLQGGVLLFDLDVTFRETLDGSDPSADFCP
jgi:preprotein translocase subunit SecD